MDNNNQPKQGTGLYQPQGPEPPKPPPIPPVDEKLPKEPEQTGEKVQAKEDVAPMVVKSYDDPPPFFAKPGTEEPKQVPQANVQNEQKPQETGAVQTSPPLKKKFPIKLIFLVAGGLLILLVIGFLLKNLLSKEKTVSQSEIVWWGLWEEESTIAPIITEYETQNQNVKIKYVKNSAQDYRERLTNSLAKGSGPDIFMFHNTWVPMFKNELDNVPASFMATSEYAQTFYPVISSDLTSGTGFVGVPFGYDALTMYINEDMFNQESVLPPSTWVELRDVAKKLTIIEDGKIVRAGVALGRTENVDHWPEILGLMLVQNNVNLNSPEGQLAEDALKFYTIFSSVDRVWDETQPPSTVAFASGKLAIYFGPSWRAFEIMEQNPELKFRTVPLPQLPKEDPSETDVAYATYWVNGVWERGNNKQEAWKFLKFLTQNNIQDKLYQKESSVRGFGQAYPRVDMRDQIKEHPVLGSIVSLAPYAQSWYLADRTSDGSTGINSQIIKYFEDAVNLINKGEEPTDAMETVASGVNQILSQYGLVK